MNNVKYEYITDSEIIQLHCLIKSDQSTGCWIYTGKETIFKNGSKQFLYKTAAMTNQVQVRRLVFGIYKNLDGLDGYKLVANKHCAGGTRCVNPEHFDLIKWKSDHGVQVERSIVNMFEASKEAAMNTIAASHKSANLSKIIHTEEQLLADIKSGMSPKLVMSKYRIDSDEYRSIKSNNNK